MLVNLAVNARDAMPEGGKLVIETFNVAVDERFCRSHQDSSPGEYVMFAISDTGFGMSKDTLARIFEPFFTTKPHEKGTGLGLSMVYGIVKQNNGFISVYSEPGQGTMFKIFLPRIKDKEAAAEIKAELPGLPIGDETILLVEDEVMVRNLAAKILTMQGYKVLDATDCDDAIELCGSHPGDIHMLLSDVVMPNMNGKELYERIRSIKPGIKVLYMSGYTENFIAQRGVLDPGTNFISKPFTIEALARKVREALGR